MCGDLYCWSCGPAQGNYKCEICGKWSEDGGCDNPQECHDKAEKMYAQLAKDLEKEKELADQYAEEEAKAQAAREEEVHLCPHGKSFLECNACLAADDRHCDEMRERNYFGRF